MSPDQQKNSTASLPPRDGGPKQIFTIKRMEPVLAPSSIAALAMLAGSAGGLIAMGSPKADCRSIFRKPDDELIAAAEAKRARKAEAKRLQKLRSQKKA